MRGDFLEAKKWLGEFHEIWGGTYPREEPFITEVRARYMMQAEGWVPSDEDMVRLLQMYRHSRRYPSSDMFVLMLVEAYAARGDGSKGLCLARDYILRYRRERAILTPMLKQKLSAMGVQFEQ